MGYIGTLAGMPVNNIQPAALSECDQDRHETALANRVLQYQRLPLSSGRPGRRSSSTTSPASGS